MLSFRVARSARSRIRMGVRLGVAEPA